MKKRIWAFSDTHGMHCNAEVPLDIDIAIFAGDCSNHMSPIHNHGEVIDFLLWYSILNIKYKIMIAGNHDIAIFDGSVSKEYIESLGIIYLENSEITIEGIKIFGSPYTPRFGPWAFMKSLDALRDMWANLDVESYIIITHGPPYSILDLNESGINCGDHSLLNFIKKVKPAYHLFGHIHNNEHITNTGIRILNDLPTQFINVSTVNDGRGFFNGLTGNGNVIEI